MKTVVLLMGRGGSKSIKKKNTYPILNRPLSFYPMHAAMEAEKVDHVYVSTDCEGIMAVARELGVSVIERPERLAQDDSEMTDVILHALEEMPHQVDILVTMHCNYAVHREGLVDDCISMLLARPDADSCVTGYVDKAVHPFRTKKVASNGMLETWMSVPEGTSNNRQSLEGCFILDGAVRAIRVANCFPPRGQRPFTYLGSNILPLENWKYGDVHGEEDLILVEHGLKKLGWKPG